MQGPQSEIANNRKVLYNILLTLRNIPFSLLNPVVEEF